MRCLGAQFNQVVTWFPQVIIELIGLWEGQASQSLLIFSGIYAFLFLFISQVLFYFISLFFSFLFYRALLQHLLQNEIWFQINLYIRSHYSMFPLHKWIYSTSWQQASQDLPCFSFYWLLQGLSHINYPIRCSFGAFQRLFYFIYF
jgi:hypothetical protein